MIGLFPVSGHFEQFEGSSFSGNKLIISVEWVENFNFVINIFYLTKNLLNYFSYQFHQHWPSPCYYVKCCPLNKLHRMSNKAYEIKNMIIVHIVVPRNTCCSGILPVNSVLPKNVYFQVWIIYSSLELCSKSSLTYLCFLYFSAPENQLHTFFSIF